MECGLVNVHSIQGPTDDDLQPYPHFSFKSPNIWDASVLDHDIAAELLDEINQEVDDSLHQDSLSDEFIDLHQRVVKHLDVFWDLSTTETGEHAFHAQFS